MIEIYPEELNKIVAQMSTVKNMKFKFHIEDNVLYWVDSNDKKLRLILTHAIEVKSSNDYYGCFDVTPNVIDLIKLTIKSVENRYNVTNVTVEVRDVLDYIEKHKYKREVYVF